MIRYVYGGTIPPSELRKRSGVFIEIADRCGIKNLKMEAEAWYVKSDLITAENFVEVFTFAHRMNCPLLMEEAAHYFLNEPEAILKSSSFDFVDVYEHALKNGPDLLRSLAEAFFVRHGKRLLPLYGKRIAKSYKMSHRLLHSTPHFFLKMMVGCLKLSPDILLTACGESCTMKGWILRGIEKC